MSTPGKFLIDGTTGTVLTLAAPPAPGFIRILSLTMTVSAASTVELLSGSTVKGKAFLGTGNDYEQDGQGQGGVIDCEPGDAFTITSSAGTIAGSGLYTVVGAMPPGGYNLPNL